jgi:hypothetical protein
MYQMDSTAPHPTKPSIAMSYAAKESEYDYQKRD